MSWDNILPWYWLPYVTVGSDLVQGIVWPAAVVVGALVFSAQLKDLAARIIELHFGVGKAVFAPPPDVVVQARGQIEIVPEAPLRIDEPQQPGRPFVLDPPSQAIADLENQLWPMVEATPEQERLPRGVRAIATLQFSLTAERQYRAIFGSQIAFLRNLAATSPLPLDIGRMAYNNARGRYPEFYAGYTFEQWIGFLQTSGLAVTDHANASITHGGLEFLTYMLRNQMADWKLY